MAVTWTSKCVLNFHPKLITVTRTLYIPKSIKLWLHVSVGIISKRATTNVYAERTPTVDMYFT